MCPDKKLKWFKDHGRTPAQIRDIKKLVITRWNETYKGDEEPAPAATAVPQRGKVSVEFIAILSINNNNLILAQVKVGGSTGI
jgi:hypothetical protein